VGKRISLTGIIGLVLLAAGLAALAYGGYQLYELQQGAKGVFNKGLKFFGKTTRAEMQAYTYLACGAVGALAGAYLAFARRGRR